MFRKFVLLGLLAALSCGMTSAAEPAAEVVIAAPGKPPAIVVPAEMEDQVKLAVDDLQNYLRRITDLQAPVVQGEAAGPFGIYVGDVAANRDLQPLIEKEQLGRDGFVLDVSAQGVRILGGSKFGTAYGVYEFLERLAVRWLFPGEWGEVVPHAATISLPAGRFTDKPGFIVRRMATNYYYDRRIYGPDVMRDASDRLASYPEIGDWRRRNRQNSPGFNGHSALIPPKTYGKEHPEWFAEIDGKRVLDPGNWKLCHSNKAMVQQAIVDVLDQIRQRKAGKKVINEDGFKVLPADYFIISVSPTDGGGFCRCAECQKMGSISDRLQIFANEIADAVRKEFPDYWVGYYGAYSEAQIPPTVEAHPGVMVFTTNYTRSFFFPITDTANNSFRKKLEAWYAECPNKAMGDFDGIPEWWGYGPVSLVDIHKVDYPWYFQRGVQGISTHAPSGWGGSGYSYYITTKMWWHPDLDVEALKRDFVKSAYGEAFEPMWRYHERLDKAKVFVPPATLYALRQDLEEAVRIAQPQRPDVRLRLDYLRAYYLLLDTYTKGLSKEASPEELRTALRVSRSIDFTVTALRKEIFKWMLGAPAGEVKPYTADELHQLLDQVVLSKPGNDLSAWADGDDLHLVPLVKKEHDFSTDLGGGLRYGPTTLLIYAAANERIKVTQEGKFTETDFELRGPEQTVIEKGTAEKETIVDLPATTEGIYTLVISTSSSYPRIHVSNQAAVIKSCSAQQPAQVYGKAEFYFYVPKGTREFALVTKPQSKMTMEVWGPYNAAKPVYPLATQAARVFQEHRIVVPPGSDGATWRVQMGGETDAIFLLGIPPFLAGGPDRLLVLP